MATKPQLADFNRRSSGTAAPRQPVKKLPQFQESLQFKNPTYRKGAVEMDEKLEVWRKSLNFPSTVVIGSGGGGGTTVVGAPGAKGDRGKAGDKGDKGEQGSAGAGSAQGWVTNVSTGRLHQVVLRYNLDGDAEWTLEPKEGVDPASVNWQASNGFEYWSSIGAVYFALRARNNRDVEAEAYLSDGMTAPDLFIPLYNPDDGKFYKYHARNNRDGEPEPWLERMT